MAISKVPLSFFSAILVSVTLANGSHVCAFGRLDEIGKSPLPKCGLGADSKKYSGTVISAYPEELLGDWGGELKIFSFKVSETYKFLDPATSLRSVTLLRPGRIGRSSFCFHKDASGKIVLDPVSMVLMVPMNETRSFHSFVSQHNLSASEAADFGRQLGPGIKVDFENAQTSANAQGIGGGEFVTRVFKTTIRQLAPDTFEKQIFTRSTVRLPSKATYRPTDENVIWFKLVPADKNLYVRICGLSYSEKGQLLSKLVISGTLVKGRKVETDPNPSRKSEQEMNSEIDRLRNELRRLKEEAARGSQ